MQFHSRTSQSDEKDNRPLPQHFRKPRLTARDKNSQRNQATEKKALQTKEATFRADTDIVKIRHVIISILPCVITTSLRPCTYSNKSWFRHVEAEEKPSKKSKKGGSKGSIAMLKESMQLGCVSQDSHPRKSIST